jgi:hypothetical protein
MQENSHCARRKKTSSGTSRYIFSRVDDRGKVAVALQFFAMTAMNVQEFSDHAQGVSSFRTCGTIYYALHRGDENFNSSKYIFAN